MSRAGDQIFEAFALPASAILNQRIAKKILAGQAATAAGDRKLLLERVEQITWKAVLKPNTVNIPEFSDADCEYREISVLVAQLRGEGKGDRLGEIIQRSIPYPLILLLEDSHGVQLWLASKRKSASNPQEFVVAEHHVSPVISDATDDAVKSAFLQSLSLKNQPHKHLFALYQGWLACLTGLRAAAHTGQFSGPLPEAAARKALAEMESLRTQIQQLTSRALKEKQLNRRVELNLEIKTHEAALAKLITGL